MRGLRFTQIKSEGFELDFYRYQLSEHYLTMYSSNIPNILWGHGAIIHHLKTWGHARELFNRLAPEYDEVDVVWR